MNRTSDPLEFDSEGIVLERATRSSDPDADESLLELLNPRDLANLRIWRTRH